MGDYFTVRNGGMSTKIDDTHLREDATWSSDKINQEIENKVVGAGGHLVTDSTINGNIRIDGVETEVFVHPTTHPATMIEEDSTHRFVTNAEKGEWSGKSKVTSSVVNGNIKVDNNETTVYTHPSTHSATIVTETTEKQFVSQTDKDKWNGMAESDTTTIQVGSTEVKAGKVTLIAGSSNVHLNPSVAGSSVTISVDDPTLPEIITNHANMTNLDYDSSGHIGFAKSVHTHTFADVDALTNTLDGKLNVPANSQTGDILVRNGAGWTRLPAGTNGQLLTTQGSAGSPIWTTVSTGGTGGSGILIGALIDRPPAGTPNRIFLNTENNQLYRDNGLTWVAINAAQIVAGTQTFAWGLDQPAEGAETPKMLFPNAMSLLSVTFLLDVAPTSTTYFNILKTNQALGTVQTLAEIPVSTASTVWNVPVYSPINIEINDVMYVKLNSPNNGLNRLSIIPKVVNR